MKDGTNCDPLETKEYPTLHRLEVREYKALEPKMCENCDGSFLRVVGSELKYCRNCTWAGEMVQ